MGAALPPMRPTWNSALTSRFSNLSFTGSCFLERTLDVREHQVRAAGFELERPFAGHVVARDFAHSHHAFVVDVHVELDFGRDRRGR
jgi:hypothetical protein